MNTATTTATIANTWRGTSLRKYPTLPCASAWITSREDFEHLEGVWFEPKQVGTAPSGAPVYVMMDNATLAYLNGKNINIHFEVIDESMTTDSAATASKETPSRRLSVTGFTVLGLANGGKSPADMSPTIVTESFDAFLVRWIRDNTIVRKKLEKMDSDNPIETMRVPTNEEMQQ